MDTCDRCLREVKVMKCARCLSIGYCGKDCQREDWPGHKLVCRESYHDRVAELLHLLDSGEYEIPLIYFYKIHIFPKGTSGAKSFCVVLQHREKSFISDYNCLICGEVLSYSGPYRDLYFQARPGHDVPCCQKCHAEKRKLCHKSYFPTEICPTRMSLQKEKMVLFMLMALEVIPVDIIRLVIGYFKLLPMCC